MSDGYALDWDSTVENDGAEFVLLPEGTYKFSVVDFQRGRFPGSSKIPPCNKAELTLAVDTENGRATVKTDLILYSSLEWKISSFFRCVGLKKHGEVYKPTWDNLIGLTGMAHFKPRSWTDNNGNERQANDCDKFLDPEETPQTQSKTAEKPVKKTAKKETPKVAEPASDDDDLLE